jgi:hypothetical protein
LYPIYVKLWFTKSVSIFVAVETVEPAPVMKSESFLVPENTPACPSTIPRYVKGWARRGSVKKNKAENLFIEDIIRLPCASKEYVILSTHKHKPKQRIPKLKGLICAPFQVQVLPFEKGDALGKIY